MNYDFHLIHFEQRMVWHACCFDYHAMLNDIIISIITTDAKFEFRAFLYVYRHKEIGNQS